MAKAMGIANAISQERLAVAISIFLAFFVLVAYLEKRRKPKQDADPDKDSSSYKKAAPPNERDNHPSDGEHRSAEQAYWRWQMNAEERRHRVAIVTLILSIIAIVAAGLSFWESRIQAVAAQDQITAMRDAQRAWLKISSIQGNSATRAQGIGVAWFGFTPSYKNVGQTPAQGIDFNFHIFVVGVGPSPAKTCDAERRNYIGGSGKIVFPQEEVQDDWTAIQVAIFELNEQAARVHAIQPASRIYLGIIGCVLYVFTGSNSVHVVGFAGDVDLAAAEHDRNKSLYDIVTTGDGPVDVKIKVIILAFGRINIASHKLGVSVAAKTLRFCFIFRPRWLLEVLAMSASGAVV